MKITLRQARIGAGLTQKEMANALKLSTPTYAFFEANPDRLRLEYLKKFSMIVGVKPENLDVWEVKECLTVL